MQGIYNYVRETNRVHGYVLLWLFCIYSLLISLLILYRDMETSSWLKRIIQTELHICHENYESLN